MGQAVERGELTTKLGNTSLHSSICVHMIYCVLSAFKLDTFQLKGPKKKCMNVSFAIQHGKRMKQYLCKDLQKKNLTNQVGEEDQNNAILRTVAKEMVQVVGAIPGFVRQHEHLSTKMPKPNPLQNFIKFQHFGKWEAHSCCAPVAVPPYLTQMFRLTQYSISSVMSKAPCWCCDSQAK